MRLNSLSRWLAMASLAALALVASGCGGLAAAGAVSPLQFLLPGLIQTKPAPAPDAPPPPALAGRPVELAQSH